MKTRKTDFDALNSESWGELFSALLLKQERDKERENEFRPL